MDPQELERLNLVAETLARQSGMHASVRCETRSGIVFLVIDVIKPGLQALENSTARELSKAGPNLDDFVCNFIRQSALKLGARRW
ncbi:MAG TPA: hypothetical protein VMG11_02065 [Steroidobacteraceae bacterium]|nr:hypothetical protein [Steroidobacteraceae bacterium]